jgi:hypothetical protein
VATWTTKRLGPAGALFAFLAAGSTRTTKGEIMAERLPRTDAEASLLKAAIAELLRTIPETWAEFDLDRLTVIHNNALFLLTAAGLVERRGWLRSTIANQRMLTTSRRISDAIRVSSFHRRSAPVRLF